MTRITERIMVQRMLQEINDIRVNVDKHSQEIATGMKVFDPGDSTLTGTISGLNGVLEKVEGAGKRTKVVQSLFQYQDDVLAQSNELLIRAKEVAQQAANESNSPTERLSMSGEIFELRDHLVSLANSQYQGAYVFHGALSDIPPYSENTPYTNPPIVGTPAVNPQVNQRYTYDTSVGSTLQNSVKITEDFSITTNTPGNTVFDRAIEGLERLGRAMAGYRSTPAAQATTDGGGTAYVFPTEFNQQTQDILASIDVIDTARESDIMPERVAVAGRMKRVETAESLLELTKVNTTEVLSGLQDADIFESATELQNAQTALEASLTVNSRLLNLSILNYL